MKTCILWSIKKRGSGSYVGGEERETAYSMKEDQMPKSSGDTATMMLQRMEKNNSGILEMDGCSGFGGVGSTRC